MRRGGRFLGEQAVCHADGALEFTRRAHHSGRWQHHHNWRGQRLLLRGICLPARPEHLYF